MKISGSQFYKDTEIRELLELTLTFLLAEANALIHSWSKRARQAGGQMGPAVSGAAERSQAP